MRSLDHDDVAGYRILCLRYISQLNNHALIEASEALKELYEQQSCSYVVPFEPTMKRTGVTRIRQMGKLW